MTDAEVESTLREIRERVRAEVRAVVTARPAQPAPVDAVTAPARANDVDALADALARLDVNLATAERAWNRLPPLMSYREGLAARLELWVKRQIKRAAHWFTWEQVNFNAAVHHALRDTRSAVEACRQQLQSLQSAADAEAAARRQSLAELEARVVSLIDERSEESRSRVSGLRSHVDVVSSRVDEVKSHAVESRSRVDSLGSHVGELESRVGEFSSLTGARLDEVTAETQRQASAREALRDELRDRVGHVLEEQRVALRQLSLEASERAVMHDRARRDLEARLEEISKAL